MTSKASGYRISASDVSIVLGMVARDDRDHDIAAWFGVNQGRIKDTKDGKFGTAVPASARKLPPKGPPGIKGRRLRGSVNEVLTAIEQNSPDVAKAKLLARFSEP